MVYLDYLYLLCYLLLILHDRKLFFVNAKSEFNSFASALELYYDDNDSYPPDASHDVPPWLEPYLSGTKSDEWPDAPWPDSVYDWDNPDGPGRIYQISIRFCPLGGALASCHFPEESWAEDFDVNSAVYYCIEGSCRSHINEPLSYPGYCVNCEE